MRYENTLQGKAGLPGPRHHDVAGIIPAPVPWVKSPRMVIALPRIVSENETTELHTTASCMDQPGHHHSPQAPETPPGYAMRLRM